MKTKFSIVSFFSIIFFAFFLIGCGSSDSGDPPGEDPVMITGMAAAGLPIVGIVNVKGAAGNTASANIEIDGSYELDVSALTAPYVLFARGAVDGESIELYSTGVEAGAINITPITNLITKEVMGDLDNLFDNWSSESTTVNVAAIEAAETKIQTQLAPILESYGITDDIDLMSVDFDTDHSGLDAVLDVLEITIDASNDVTITNITTGTSVTGDEPFNEDEANAIAVVISETAAMNTVWSTITTAFATSLPSIAEVSSDIAPLYANDYLFRGANRDEELGRYSTGDFWPIGIQLSLMIYKPMDSSADHVGYEKGYWIKVLYKWGTIQGSNITGMVYNGTNWLLYGDRKWFSHDFKAIAMKIERSEGTTKYTGWRFEIRDRYNYAWDNGIRSIIVTGPGLQDEGIVMYRDFPDDSYTIHTYPGYWDDTLTYPAEYDWVYEAIPENSEYTIRAYSELHTDVSLDAHIPDVTYTDVVANKPLLNSELSDDLFPTITSHTTHSLSDLDISSDIEVTWTAPVNSDIGWSPAWIHLGWGDGTNDLDKEVTPDLGSTSVTIDTTTNNIDPITWACLEVNGMDIFGRLFIYEWSFNN